MNLFEKLKKKRHNKTVLIGLDGVPYSLLSALKKKGLIPNMGALFENGYFGPMRVCIPEISSVSWTSFMTGKQPGEHGIFGFIDLQPNTYSMVFPNYSHLRTPTLWDDLGRIQKKSVVINMPATYPARKINGALISGFVAIDMSKAVYPTSLIPQLHGINYRIDVDTAKARFDHDFLFQELESTLEGRRKAADLLWKEIDWDLFVIVITGTDRLMHFLWDACEDASHKHHQDFLDYFGKVDGFVGWMVDRLTSMPGYQETTHRLIMLSDHGFTKIKSEVYLNRWLQDNGYLHFEKNPPETIMDIGPNSRAFALDPSRIYINLKGKYPLGTVDKSDYEKIRQEIQSGLEILEYNGHRDVIRNIYHREELYEGPFLDQAPDLVLLSNHGFDLKGRVTSENVFGRTDLSGMHTQDDAFFFSSHGTSCNSIFDAKKIIAETFK